MARTPLLSKVQELQSVVAKAGTRNISVDHVLDERRTTRRRFLRDAGALAATGAAATTFSRFVAPARAAGNPQIVIVGAGLAGLTCAYRLKQAGYAQTSTRPPTAWAAAAGRCRGDFADGQIAEHGGELIDQGHTQMRQLAQELGLNLDNLLAGAAERHRGLLLLRRRAVPVRAGRRRPERHLPEAAQGRLGRELPDPLDSSHAARLGARPHVDHRLAQRDVPGRRDSKLGQLLDVAYNIEYGAECSEQSALNLLYLLGYSGQGQFRVFGKSNEKYHVRGGNDQIADGARGRARRPDPHRASAADRDQQNTGGSYTLTFQNGAGTKTVTADHVVLALPFSILRARVDYSKAGFEPLKVTAIQELGMGTNSKLHVQFATASGTRSATTATPTRTPATRTPGRSRAPSPAPSGILVDYTGGNDRRELRLRHAGGRERSSSSEQIEPVLPGITAAVERPGHRGLLARQPVDEGLVLLLEGRAVHEVLRHGTRATGQLPLRRRAHLDRLPGLPQRRRRDRASGWSRRSSAT